MYRIIPAAIGLGSVLSLAAASGLDTKAEALLYTQRTYAQQWIAVSRVSVAQRYSRRIRITGPWMDHVVAVAPTNGLSTVDFVKTDKQVEMTLRASEAATTGDVNLKVIVDCPFFTDCASSITLPVRVFETGVITRIQPYGTVPANMEITFDLWGEAFDVAKLLPRLLKLKNAAILQQTATKMRVRGTTPSCGSVDIALTNKADGADFYYPHESTVQRIRAGTECFGSVDPSIPSAALCTTGQVWDSALRACRGE